MLLIMIGYVFKGKVEFSKDIQDRSNCQKESAQVSTFWRHFEKWKNGKIAKDLLTKKWDESRRLLNEQ